MEPILSQASLAQLSHTHLYAPHLQSEKFAQTYISQIEDLAEPHLWVPTSGTQSLKWVGLSHSGILRAAKEMNLALGMSTSDVVLAPLPLSHVSGLMPYYRAAQGAYHFEAYTSPWDPELYEKALINTGATLSSLVPTQVFDLVQSAVRAPPRLRHVLVGGAPLSQALAAQFTALGWPLLISWGATETSAACALFRPELACYELLPHVESQWEEGIWTLSGASIATALVDLREPNLRLLNNKWQSSDQVRILDERHFVWEGRRDRIIKNRGEKISLNAVQSSVQSYLWQRFGKIYDVHAEARLDEREGQAVKVHIETQALPVKTDECMHDYNTSQAFHLRTREWLLVKSFSRLGKERLP